MKVLTPSLLCLAAASGLLAGCSHEQAPAPADPTPSATMSRQFAYPSTGAVLSAEHASPEIKAEATEQPNVVTLDFTTTPDEVYFALDRAALGTQWVGTYALRCQQRPTDPVFTSFLYARPQVGATAIVRLSDWTPQLGGSVTITRYDAARHLVSGSYRVAAAAQRDLAEATSPAQPCDLTVAGTFTDPKLAVRP